MTYRIGIDGGGTKTECILLDASGTIVARHLAPGCNPNVLGPEAARRVIVDALAALLSPFPERPRISHLHVYAAGNRAWWRETAASLGDYGDVFTADDSHPVLELATHGQPGLVLHGGTGSFVAARASDGAIHYAGGIGWRFGDGGSGYDLGRRAIGRALLELQGWARVTPLSAMVRDATQLGATADAALVTRFFYQHAEPNRQIAALAPALLELASDGEPAAKSIVYESVGELVSLALAVIVKLFPGIPHSALTVGLSGPILTHPFVIVALAERAPLTARPVEGTPIEGVRRLLARAT